MTFLVPDLQKIPAAAGFVKAFESKYGPASSYGPLAYEAANIVLDAVKRAGKTDLAAVRTIRATKDFKGILGFPITFDDKGDVAGGVLVGLYYTQIDFVMGYSAGLKAFTAAVLGGIGNIRGAMLGGLLLGIAESLAVTFINPAYKDVVAFAILILTLVVRATGILGESVPDAEKVSPARASGRPRPGGTPPAWASRRWRWWGRCWRPASTWSASWRAPACTRPSRSA